MTNLLKGKPKGKKPFTAEARAAFSALKKRLTSAPILKMPDPMKPFIVEVDASEVGLGAVRSQRQGKPEKLHLCVSLFRKLTPVEANYDIGNWELLAIKTTLKEW